MTAALATLAFLATLWLTIVAAARMLEESGSKIMAALAGRSPLAMSPVIPAARFRVSVGLRARQPLRARPRLRAAA